MTKPTETQVEAALQVLRADYYQDVRGVAEAWRDAKKWAQTHGQEFDAHDALHQAVDNSARVIYTYKAKIGLLVSHNENAYEEEFGAEALSTATIEQRMFVAMHQDVIELLQAEGEVF